jgi:hypothetical protein
VEKPDDASEEKIQSLNLLALAKLSYDRSNIEHFQMMH